MTLLLALLRRYWLHMAALATVAVLVGWFYSWAKGNGVNEERALWLAKENKALTAAVAERDRAIADRNEAQRKADRLDKPQREVAKSAKANPSGCDLAKPTGDKLRKQAAETNAAIP